MKAPSKKDKAKKAEKGKKGGQGLEGFHDTGANLFGYLSQAYTSTDSAQTRTVSSIYENEEAKQQLQQMDPQLKLIFKKLQKKDGETKTKGLLELKTELDSKTPEELAGVAGYCVYVYSKLMATVRDRKIRALANSVLGVFVARAKKSLGAHIEKLMPFWYMAMNDPAADVVSVANENYSACFPKDRQAKVLQLSCKAFFELVNEYLRTPKESIVEDFGSMSDADKEEVYECVVSSSLRGVSQLFALAATDPELKKNYADGVVEMLMLEEAESPLARFLSGKYKSGIRAAALELIVSLLENIEGKLIKAHEGKLSEFVLYSVGENNLQIQFALWSKALLKFVRTCDDCWKHVNLKKAFLNRLYQCLRKAAFGAAPPLYKNFVVFLSLCPFLKIDPAAKLPEAAVPKKGVDVESAETSSAISEAEQKTEATSAQEQKKDEREDKKATTKKDKKEGKKAKDETKKGKKADPKKGEAEEAKGEGKKKQKDSDKSRKPISKNESLDLAEQLATIKSIHDNLIEAIFSEETAMHAELLVASYFDCSLFTIWKRLVPFWKVTADERAKEAVVNTATGLLDKVIDIFMSRKAVQQRVYEILERGFANFFNEIWKKDMPADFLKLLESATLQRLTKIFTSDESTVGKTQMNLLHVLCSQVDSQHFSAALNKLVIDYHRVIRSQIAAEVARQTAGGVNVQLLLSRFHLYCLFTYKYLCVTDRPLLSPAYEVASDTLPECEWLISLLSNGNSNLEAIKYALLSASAVFGSTGSTYQGPFDKLLGLSCEEVKHAEGLRLLEKYAVNPLSVTWELETELLHRESKRDKFHPPPKGQLRGIVALLNASKIWREVLGRRLKKMLDNKEGKENMGRFKKLFAELGAFYCEKREVNICDEAMSMIVKQIMKETSECKDVKKLNLIEDITTSFINALISLLSTLEGELRESLDEYCKSTLLMLHGALSYYGQEISQSRLWTLISKLTSANLYYDHYVLVMQNVTKTFLGAPREEAEITKFTSFFKAFLAAVNSRTIKEIQIIKDILLTSHEMLELTCTELFSNLSKLRVFTELFLRGGVGTAVPTLLMAKDKDYPYIGLTCEILKALYLPCTSKTVATRNQITLYTDMELIPFFVSPHTPMPEDDKVAFVLALVQRLEKNSIERGSLYPFALEHLMGKLMEAEKEGRTVLEGSIYEKFFSELVPERLEEIVSGNDERTYSLVLHFLGCVKTALCKSEEYLEFIRKVKAKALELSKNEEIEPLVNLLGIYSTTMTEEEDLELTKEIFPKVIAKLSTLGILLQRKAILYISRLLHYSIKTGIDKMLKESNVDSKDLVTTVFQGLKTCEKEDETVPSLLLPLCDIVTLFAVFQSSFPTVDMVQVTIRLIELTYLKSQEYNLRLEGNPVVVHELEYEMFEALGKLLERCVKFVASSFSEELLYSLISSNIEAIQKAGYKLLKRVYIEYLPGLPYPVAETWGPESLQFEGEEIKEEYTKYTGLSKNIPMVLIETIEHVPSLSSSYRDILKESKKSAADVESIVEDVEEDKETLALHPDTYGYLLCWSVILDKVYYGWLHSRKEKNEDYLAVLNSISVYLNDNKAVYVTFLMFLAAYLPTSNAFCASLKEEDIIGFDPSSISLTSIKDINKFALYCLFNFMKNYPSLARNFYNQCDHMIGKIISSVVSKVIGPTIWHAESTNLHNCQDILKENQLEVTMMYANREILASMIRDDVEFSISLKFPGNYPLKSIEVANLKSGVVSEHEMRSWSLTMTRLISSQNCDVLGALLLWKTNYDRKFEGVEPCPICYCIVHEDTYSIPTLQCKTCKNKFHAACLKKWFRTSHKNKCPFCQNYFF